MAELKPCPFCGAPSWDLECGTVENPDAFWDGGMGGERYGYVMCYQCNAILKAYNMDESIEAWNKRADAQEVRHGRWVRFIGMESHYFCDQCRRHVEDRTGKPWKAFPYCHCGAKMDEEVE